MYFQAIAEGGCVALVLELNGKRSIDRDEEYFFYNMATFCQRFPLTKMHRNTVFKTDTFCGYFYEKMCQ